MHLDQWCPDGKSQRQLDYQHGIILALYQAEIVKNCIGLFAVDHLEGEIEFNVVQQDKWHRVGSFNI